MQPNFEFRIREKIQRWHLPGPAATVARRITKRLGELQGLVAPRVQSACLSTLFNRWCTPRRFQQRDSHRNRCLLGCPGLAEDSIEHYVHCGTIHAVADTYLHMRQYFPLQAEHFMLASRVLQDGEVLTCMAILTYAAYMATNHYRQSGAVCREVAIESLKQHCRNAVRRHSSSVRILDRRWSMPPGQHRRATETQQIPDSDPHSIWV